MNMQSSAPAAAMEIADQASTLADLEVAAGGDGHAIHVTVIEGGPGSGKSALLHRIGATAGAGSRVLRASASSRESDFALGVIRQLFELPLATAPARDRRGWLRGAAALVPQLLSLGPGLRAEASGNGHTISHAFFWLAANISRQAPLMILIDDLQWADLASLRWLVHLGRRSASLPLTVVATIDSGQHQAYPDQVAALLAGVRRVPAADLAATVLPLPRAAVVAPAAPAPVPVSASPRPAQRPAFGPAALTPHERRLITMAVNGRTNGEIAENFGVTRRAVEFHFTQIYRKLGISRRPQLYRFTSASAALSRRLTCQQLTEASAHL
jgi:DNA-binding CsgD family transcriptional regulator